MNENDLITIESNNLIKKWDIKNPKLQIQEIQSKKIKYTLFDKNVNYLYLLNYQGFQILDLQNFKFINSKKCNEIFNNPLLLNDNLLMQQNHTVQKQLNYSQ
jgi:hypothetical protein